MTPLESTALFFKSLSEPVRLRILNLLMHADSEICVCDLILILDVPQSVISRHLAYLRKTNVVSARREGVWMHYSINPQLDSLSKSVLHALKTGAVIDSILCEDLLRQAQQSGC